MVLGRDPNTYKEADSMRDSALEHLQLYLELAKQASSAGEILDRDSSRKISNLILCAVIPNLATSSAAPHNSGSHGN